jgi:hypothetical protein
VAERESNKKIAEQTEDIRDYSTTVISGNRNIIRLSSEREVNQGRKYSNKGNIKKVVERGLKDMSIASTLSSLEGISGAKLGTASRIQSSDENSTSDDYTVQLIDDVEKLTKILNQVIQKENPNVSQVCDAEAQASGLFSSISTSHRQLTATMLEILDL